MKIELILAGLLVLGVAGCSYNNLYRPKGERAAGKCSEEGINPGTPEWNKCLQDNNHPKYDPKRNFLK